VPRRVDATPAALEAISRVVADVGPVMFFQSGGCCDGSLPLCFRDGELIVGDLDVKLDTLAGSAFYIDHRQFALWKHTQLILDIASGEPEGFSLAAGPDQHFVIRSRVFSEKELQALDHEGQSPSPD